MSCLNVYLNTCLMSLLNTLFLIHVLKNNTNMKHCIILFITFYYIVISFLIHFLLHMICDFTNMKQGITKLYKVKQQDR